MAGRAPKFFSLLADCAEEQRLYAFARQPGRTIDQVHDWLCSDAGMVDSEEFPDHPRAVSRSAVGRWFKQWGATDRISSSADIALAVQAQHSESGTADLVGTNNLLVAQRLQDKLVAGEALSTKELLMIADATNKNATVEQRVIKVKEHYERKEAEAVKTAEAAAKSGASATDVVATIKAALGIAT